MTLVHCRGCLFWYDSRYLYRHHNNSPQCLVISQQGQEVESEQEPMMEAGEDDSESGSMVLERLLAESSEDDEHMERPTSKRDRPNSDDEYCVYNNSGLGSDESLSEEASHSSTPDDAAPIIQIEYNETRPHRQVGRSGRRVGLLLIDRSREYPGSRQKTEGRRSNGREE
jgi:hypothetical protein